MERAFRATIWKEKKSDIFSEYSRCYDRQNSAQELVQNDGRVESKSWSIIERRRRFERVREHGRQYGDSENTITGRP